MIGGDTTNGWRPDQQWEIPTGTPVRPPPMQAGPPNGIGIDGHNGTAATRSAHGNVPQHGSAAVSGGYGGGQQMVAPMMGPPGHASAMGPMAVQPPIDVFDHEETVEIRIDLPGFDTEDISISVHDRSVSVYADRQEQTIPKEQVLVHERARSFSRQITVPVRAATDEAEALYENGVLTVRLPKAEGERLDVRRAD